MASSEHTVGFEPADRLAQDRESVRRRFWIKLKRVVAKLPFAEDLLAAYYCAFDKQTPRHVQAALLGAIAYFILPFDFIPDMLPVLGFTDDAAVLATAIRMVASHITPEHRDAARAALKRGHRRADGSRDQPRRSEDRLLTLRARRFWTASLEPISAVVARLRTCARAFLLGLPRLELPEQRFLVGVRLASLPRPPGSASGIRRTCRAPRARRLWVSSHCLAAGKRCQSGSGADSETSFHFGWKGGFWNVGNFVKNASTNSASLR